MSLPTPELDDETIDQLRRLLFPHGIPKARLAMTSHIAPKTPAPECECGCGGIVRSAAKGIWSRYLPGHHMSRGSGKPVTGNSERNLRRRADKARQASGPRVIP